MGMMRTPFYQLHAEHGGKFVDFAGWEMPIMFRSIHEEHRQVRTSGGAFDVSHMGRLKLTGADAGRLLERTLTRRVGDMEPNSCRYSLVCNERGGVLDDVLAYRLEEDWLLVVNASNRQKIVDHLRGQTAGLKVSLEDQTVKTAMVAIQGPAVMEQVGKFSSEVPQLKRYRLCTKNLMLVSLIISRTGYTGEDGVEVIMNASMASMVMRMLPKQSDGKELFPPIGLGARDTLRMEAAMPLYGHELNEDMDPLSAGLNWAVSLDKGKTAGEERFIGQEALEKIAAAGLKKKLVGLKLEGKRTARQGMAVKNGDQVIGEVTSGCLSPTLGYPIAMAYVESDRSEVGTPLLIDLGANGTAAEVVKLPFYKCSSK